MDCAEGKKTLPLSGLSALQSRKENERIQKKGESELDDNKFPACFDNGSVPLAIAYVPFQRWGMLYDEKTALQRGTIFKQLDKPFIGEEAAANG
ncbi:MAG: spore coat associated protein CotJA [Provencibacterium sp.]|jgi:hypothetical protein|nr:spore coat associated protein CotJA [Provencibacterium sp.]